MGAISLVPPGCRIRAENPEKRLNFLVGLDSNLLAIALEYKKQQHSGTRGACREPSSSLFGHRGIPGRAHRIDVPRPSRGRRSSATSTPINPRSSSRPQSRAFGQRDAQWQQFSRSLDSQSTRSSSARTKHLKRTWRGGQRRFARESEAFPFSIKSKAGLLNLIQSTRRIKHAFRLGDFF